MAEYTLADAVADRDEAYRLLHAAEERLDRIRFSMQVSIGREWTWKAPIYAILGPENDS